jgi:hypothetical protein
MTPLLDAKAAAELLGMTEGAVRWHVQNDAIPYIKLGHYVRFEGEELLVWEKPPSRRGGRPGPRPGARTLRVPARDGDKHQAHGRVARLVKHGYLPRPETLACSDCAGSAEEYDHHLGYAAEHHEHVEAVCRPCHRRRHAESTNAGTCPSAFVGSEST